MKRRVTAALLLLIAAGAVGAALGAGPREDGDSAAPVSGSRGPYLGSEPPGGIRLPRFALRDDNGEVVRSDRLGGKVVVLTVLDSHCDEACPVIARDVALAVDRLTGAERGKVEALGISANPVKDTPSSIRRFLRRRGALGKVRFLDGDEGDLRRVWRALGVLSSLESGDDDMHSAPVRIYDGHGTWVATQHAGIDLTSRNLVHDIRVALRAS